ncbi:uncharacterized protein LOC143305347 [Osmia lignaria lignaria]|uniref:uncharacterized protein LOC143305347 n=1 Tax=Osmia lignaria lignaria TaxID=1437193 RepID=UPI00402B9DFB
MRNNSSRRPSRPQAIAVRFGKEATFADILRKVKEKVKSVKQTRAGNLLIEFTPNADLESFKNNIDGKLGSEVEVARLQQKMDIELKGIDPSVDREEILAAIMKELGNVSPEVKIKVLRVDPRQNKVAIVEGPAAVMLKLVKKAKIKIGWTVVMVKEIPRLTRCFRCHEFGHIASNCKNANNATGFCRKCGSTDHQMRECSAQPRCRLCLKDNLPEEMLMHIAASVRCPRAKNDLLKVTAEETEVDVVAVTEPFTSIPDYWFTDPTKRAAIWVTMRGLKKNRCIMPVVSGKGFIIIRMGDFYIGSCYASPNAPIKDFEDYLAVLHTSLSSLRKLNLVITGDFNAKSPVWGSDRWPSLDILKDSIVLVKFSASDHRYLKHVFNVKRGPTGANVSPFDLVPGKINAEKLVEKFLEKYANGNFENLPAVDTRAEVDLFLEDLKRMVTECTGKPINPSNFKSSVPWWNEEVARKRAEAHKTRRKYTRCKRKGDPEALRKALLDYKEAKRSLGAAISTAKKDCWKE